MSNVLSFSSDLARLVLLDPSPVPPESASLFPLDRLPTAGSAVGFGRAAAIESPSPWRSSAQTGVT
jgi:hypothetical protein